MMDENNLLFAPFIASYVETLVRDGKIGVMVNTPHVSQINTGCALSTSAARCADRFRLQLVYAGQTLCWEVIFNSNYPSEPPDFIFLSDENMFQPDIADLKTLCSWNATDTTSLLKAVCELFDCYKNYHLSRLAGHRLEYDFNTLVDSPGYKCPMSDIEVYVSHRNGVSCGPVLFTIRLKIDVSSLPELLRKESCSDILLQVSYQSLDGGRVAARLQLSLFLEQLFNAYSLRPTAMPFPQDGCLVDYVLSVKIHLQKLVENIVNSHKMKEEFFAAFLALFGSSVVEYNTSDFSRMSFLFVWNDFMFLVVLSLTVRFPLDPPVISFQSIYHTKLDNSRYFAAFTDYPYSPRWSGAEMARRTRTFILEKIQEFQRSSVFEGIFM
jgi:BRCA1-A complex subunit BRE